MRLRRRFELRRASLWRRSVKRRRKKKEKKKKSRKRRWRRIIRPTWSGSLKTLFRVLLADAAGPALFRPLCEWIKIFKLSPRRRAVFTFPFFTNWIYISARDLNLNLQRGLYPSWPPARGPRRRHDCGLHCDSGDNNNYYYNHRRRRAPFYQRRELWPSYLAPRSQTLATLRWRLGVGPWDELARSGPRAASLPGKKSRLKCKTVHDGRNSRANEPSFSEQNPKMDGSTLGSGVSRISRKQLLEYSKERPFDAFPPRSCFSGLKHFYFALCCCCCCCW